MMPHSRKVPADSALLWRHVYEEKRGIIEAKRRKSCGENTAEPSRAVAGKVGGQIHIANIKNEKQGRTAESKAEDFAETPLYSDYQVRPGLQVGSQDRTGTHSLRP